MALSIPTYLNQYREQTMRQIESEVIGAFIKGQKAKKDNTQSTGNTLFLHDHAIAKIDEDGSVWVSNAGWETRTTQSRLNALCTLLGIDQRVCTRNWTMRIDTMTENDLPMGRRWHLICQVIREVTA